MACRALGLDPAFDRHGTSLIQPFWVLPVLAIAGLQAKDVMGYCAVQLLLTGIIISTGIVFL